MKSPPLRSGTLRSGPVPSGWMAALALPVLLLAAMPAAAQAPHAIPVTLRGNWFAGSCEAPEAMLALTARSAARIGKEPSRLDRFTALRDIPGWLLGTSEGVEAPRLLLRARDAVICAATQNTTECQQRSAHRPIIVRENTYG